MKHNFAKGIITMLAVAVLMAVFCFGASAAEVEWNSGAFPAYNDGDTIVVGANVEIGATVTLDKSVTIKSAEGSTYSIKASAGNIEMFNILPTATNVTFENIIVDGNVKKASGDTTGTSSTTITTSTRVRGFRFLATGASATTYATLTLGDGAILQNMRLEGGDATLGGAYGGAAVFMVANSYGVTKLETGSVIKDCSVRGSVGGAAVRLYANTKLEISGGTIQNCHASGHGAAIDAVGGTINMTTGLITGCSTVDTSSSRQGGAIRVQSAATFNLSGGAITNNTATKGDGGAVYNMGKFNMSGGYISGNTVKTNNFGGTALFNQRAGTFTLSGGVIGIHESESGSAANSGSSAAITNLGTMIMTGGYISGNKSTGTAGGVRSYIYTSGSDKGIFNMSGGEISGNSTTSSGGGIYAGGTFTLSGDAKILNNTCGSGGAGVFIAGTAELSGGEISNNKNTRASTANPSYNSGGGICASTGANVTISGNVKIHDNSAQWGAGIQVLSSAKVTISGGYIYSNEASGTGGGISVYQESGASFNMTGGVIGADAEGTAAGNTALNGGGFYGRNGTSNISGGKICNNSATYGGGIYIYGGTINLTNVEVSANSATRGGGAMFENSGIKNITDCNFTGNTATDRGGGIEFTYGNLTLLGTTNVKNNTSENDRADDIYINIGKLLVLDETFDGEIGIFFHPLVGRDDAPSVEIGTAATGANIEKAFVENVDGGKVVATEEKLFIESDSTKTYTIWDAKGKVFKTGDVFICDTYRIPNTSVLNDMLDATNGYRAEYGRAIDKVVMGGEIVETGDFFADSGSDIEFTALFLKVETQTGASVKLGAKSGLRFFGKVDYGYLGQLAEKATAGIRINNVLDGTAFESEKAKYSSKVTTYTAVDTYGQYLNMDGFEKAFSVGVNIGKDDYATSLYAQAYVRIVVGYDEEKQEDIIYIYYADFNAENHGRSAQQVAQAYLDSDPDFGTWDGTKFEALNEDQYKALCALTGKSYNGTAWVAA